MLYMLLICYDPTVPVGPDEPNRQPDHAKLEAELREEGRYVSGGALWPVESAKNVRVRDGAAVVTDGPFAETKEAIGGYFTVDCDEAEALAIAARIPVDARSWIQVRPVALFHPNVERIASLDGYVDPRLLRSSSR
jgi:hypothetical protein